jgi:uncharacterized protein (TIGR02145 family)
MKQFGSFLLGFISFACLILTACKDETNPTPNPNGQGTTVEVSSEASSLRFENGKILVSGTVNSKDNYTITSKGICFGLSALPKIKTDSVVSVGSGFGIFSIETRLSDYSREWFFRSFAISLSSSGKTDTTYGNQLSVKPFHQIKAIRLSASGIDSIAFVWDGIKACTISGLQGITGKGVCWGTGANPVPETNNFLIAGSNDSSAFSGLVSGLLPGTIYTFRAFAINAADTSFGASISCGTGLKDGEGNQYPTILIGNRLWMAANLRSAKFNDASPIEENLDNARWDSTNAPANASSTDNGVFGRYYNNHCITSDKDLCPSGWKVPDRNNWDTLFNALGGWESAGLAMKAGTTAWGASIAEGQGNSKFNALPAGQKLEIGTVANTGKLGFWWIKNGLQNPASFRITDLDKGVFYTPAAANQGFSVRCIKK